MPAVEESIVIRAPIEQVFRALTDPRRGPEWNPNIIEVSDVPADWTAQGATWRQTVMMAGRPMKLVCRVAGYRAPARGDVTISGDQRGRVWTECRPVEDGVQVIQGLEFEPPGGMLGRLAGGMISSAVRGELRQTTERQKRILEGEFGGENSTNSA